MGTANRVAAFLQDMAQEYQHARKKFPPLNSGHEAYAVMLEELEEYWEQVKQQEHKQDAVAMYRELVQLATMAMATAIERHMRAEAYEDIAD